MSLAQSKFVPHEMKSSIITIFAYDNANPVGVVRNTYYKEEIAFKSTVQLLRVLDELHDSLKFPQKSMDIRSFTDVSTPVVETANDEPPAEAEATERAALASFKIDILFRQNASWQGSVIWMERGLQAEFRSVLEFIMLLDSVMTEATNR